MKKNLKLISRIMRRKTNGLTLVELIIVVAILGIFVTTLFTVFKTSVDSWKKSEARLEIYQNARAVLEQMSREISGALIDYNSGIKFIGYDKADSSSGKDEIFFVAPLENTGRYDLCVVGYWLDEEDSELMRYYRIDTEENPLDLDKNNDLDIERGYHSDQLGLEITDLEFKFHYRSSETSDWAVTEDSWNSLENNITNYDAKGILKNPDGLPDGIEIHITLKHPTQDKEEKFHTLVSVPQAK